MPVHHLALVELLSSDSNRSWPLLQVSIPDSSHQLIFKFKSFNPVVEVLLELVFTAAHKICKWADEPITEFPKNLSFIMALVWSLKLLITVFFGW